MPRFRQLILLLGTITLSACSASRPDFNATRYDGRISPGEALRLGKIKNTPYIIDGKVYIPMDYEEAIAYEETGVASWYGQETLDKNKGQLTSYGEIFDPDLLSAAHKYLPLPCIVKVTNLENSSTIVVRVNDRGPFVGDRIIDLSAEAARQLGFYEKGTAPVRIEVLATEEELP